MKHKFSKKIIGLLALTMVCAMSLVSVFSTSARLQSVSAVNVHQMDVESEYVIGELNSEEHIKIDEAGNYYGLTELGIEIAERSDELHVYLPDSARNFNHGFLYNGGTTTETTLYDYRDKVTYFHANSLESLGNDAFKNFCHLEVVDLSDCPLTNIGFNTFGGINVMYDPDVRAGFVTTKIFLPDAVVDNNTFFSNHEDIFYDVYLVFSSDNVRQVSMNMDNLHYLQGAGTDLYDTEYFANDEMYQRKITNAIGLQINCTDNQSNKYVYEEKTVAGANDVYYVSGYWVKDSYYHSIAKLPTLSNGWVWQDNNGSELNEAKLKDLLLQAQSENKVITLDAKAVRQSSEQMKAANTAMVASISSGITIAVCGAIAGVVVIVIRKRRI